MKRATILTFILCLVMAQVGMADIDTGLIHHWKSNNNTSDETGVNDGEIFGQTAWIKGIEGNALKLLDNAYVMVNDGQFPYGSSPRTISIAVKLKGDGTPEPIFAYGVSAPGASFILKQDKDGLGIDFTGHRRGTPKAYSGWTVITVVIPASASKTSDTMIFINGHRAQEETIFGKAQPLNTGLSGMAFIGTDLPVGEFFNDAVDDLRIYNRAFSGEDIRELNKMYSSPMAKDDKNKGWSPVLGVEEDGERRVLKVVDWIGGDEKKDPPSIPVPPYIGLDGFTDISNAIDIRGAIGLQGLQGPEGPQGAQGPMGPQGPVGPTPDHEWDDTQLRFQKPDGTWGDYVDLQGQPGSSNIITGNLTLKVPSEYETIQAALAFLDDKMIAKSAVVAIQVADGTYSNYNTINANHPNGKKIHIIGNTADKSKCTIKFSVNTSIGLQVNNGNTLGLIDGFTFIGNEKEESHGILANGNATIICGKHMTVKNFYRGITSFRGSFIHANYILAIENSCCGIYASMDSLVDANYSTAKNNKEYGVLAWNGSIYFGNATSSGNGLSGVATSMGGFIRADGSIIENNQYGLRAIWNSSIQANDAIVRNNSTNFSPAKNTEGNHSSVISH